MLVDFQNSFTVVGLFLDKCATKPMTHCPPHLRCVSALPLA